MRQRARKKQKVNFKQTAFTRFMLIIAVFVLWIGGISVRLVHLQVKQHDWLREKALDNRTDKKSTKLLRGTIYDRNGRALAISVNVKTLFADATEMPDVKASAKAIAKVLGVGESKLAQQLAEAKEDEKKFVPLRSEEHTSELQS